MRRNQLVKAILLGLFLALALVLASCDATTLTEVEGGPEAEVGGDLDGVEVPPGEVSIMCHTFAPGGVAQIALLVNGSVVDTHVNTADPSAEYLTVKLSFQALQPGSYVVRCQVFGQQGASAQSAPVTLFVAGEVPSPVPGETAVPTATPTSTEVPPTPVPPTVPPAATPVPPTATRVPRSPTPVPPTRTPLPPTRTPTPLPLTIQFFEANPPSITKGSCSTLSWAVVGTIEQVRLGGPSGEGVGDHDSRQRCPNQTTTYLLWAKGPGPGNETTAEVTVVVIQPSPSPTTVAGPNITNVTESSNDMDYPDGRCTNCPYFTYVTISANIYDPDGVTAAKVTYRINRPGGQWQDLAMTQTQTALYSATIDGAALQLSLNPPVPGGPVCTTTSTLEYYVQAFDRLNNRSQSPTGTIIVHYCYVIR
jgi:hypothetical protein